MYDPELPAGFQDGDFEQAELETLAKRSSRLKKRGLCDHGWVQGNVDKTATCLHCNKTFPSRNDLENDRRRVLGI